MLRHARQATTADIYTHVLAEVQKGATDKMDGVLASLTKPRSRRRKTAL
ncbi:hypothetical protein [Nonomuraea sp. NPDC049758]